MVNILTFKARNPELFVDSGLESTSRLFSHDGSGSCFNIRELIHGGVIQLSFCLQC